MVMKKRRNMQMAYVADEAAMEEQAKFRKILQKLNFADRSDFDGIAKIAKDRKKRAGCFWEGKHAASFYIEAGK